MATNLQSALWYAEQGLNVFALTPGTKIPHKGTRGCLDATNDPDTIRAWWERWPDSNVAIATGHIVDVIDVDGPTGATSLATILQGGPSALPPTIGEVSTPNGLHLYIRCAGGGNRAGIEPGIDTRGAGGYVVAPPSIVNGTQYKWDVPLVVPA